MLDEALFSDLDAAQIAPGLWIGSAPPTGDACAVAGFQEVMLCAREYQPRSWEMPGVKVVHAGFHDQDPPDSADALTARLGALRVARSLVEGQQVLVTCWRGRNRSGLVCALALRQLYGLSGHRAIARVRAARPTALTNPAFCQMVVQAPGVELLRAQP
ncbi:MAG: dual specificity protein phosphatase family protein [Gammaproteobacteria bacterium]|nr:dual specificity protein phosphatase family protein [Gammaproteobacteria bacterium]NIR82386.1 dual specificity protein phosphatase family protein [Gammaproteobacteria bacterium]NIU03531.1 dual specificity protein phosphatase family protein [Gammaproteobacteria bacterium]NIX84805.1 hypothetical protein [Gammaproteobacteria bacterium]